MLNSELFTSTKDLLEVDSGKSQIEPSEKSDRIALVQQALLGVGFDLPESGVTGEFGKETALAVTSYRLDRGLSSRKAVVDAEMLQRLDIDVAYLEGKAPDLKTVEASTLALDPFFAGVLELQNLNAGIGQKVLDVFEFDDRMCLRASMLLGGFATISIGRMVEPFVFDDYCRNTGTCSTQTDFVDLFPGSSQYVDFLLAHNPQSDPVKIGALGSSRRPDILRHRSVFEWYEIKPFSIHGGIGAWLKRLSIIPDYADANLPYVPGTSYTPSRDIVLGRFVTDSGENVELLLGARRVAPGLIFWTLCVRGDYVRYFNRVRLAAGLLALLLAVGESLGAAAGAAEAIQAVLKLAAQLGIAPLPVLVPAL